MLIFSRLEIFIRNRYEKFPYESSRVLVNERNLYTAGQKLPYESEYCIYVNHYIKFKIHKLQYIVAI